MKCHTLVPSYLSRRELSRLTHLLREALGAKSPAANKPKIISTERQIEGSGGLRIPARAELR